MPRQSDSSPQVSPGVPGLGETPQRPFCSLPSPDTLQSDLLLCSQVVSVPDNMMWSHKRLHYLRIQCTQRHSSPSLPMDGVILSNNGRHVNYLSLVSSLTPMCLPILD